MTAVKYQFFISSTYEDLKEARKAVEETIIRAGDIPVGMEAFPAADEEQLNFIQTVIASCDYYILIIAGRYGSTDHEGVSYTEREYDFAISLGIPVIILLHGDIDNLPASSTEASEKGKRNLKAFIQKVTEKRLRKTWTSIDALKLNVREAIDYAKATKKRPGWIRGDLAPAEDILRQLVTLQVENDALKQKCATNLPTTLSDSDLLLLAHTFNFRINSDERIYSYELKWSTIFTYLVPVLRRRPPYGDIKFKLAREIAEDLNRKMDTYAHLINADMETILEKFASFGLVNVSMDTRDAVKVTALGDGYYRDLKVGRA